MNKNFRNLEVYLINVIGLLIGIGFYYYADKKELIGKIEIFAAILASVVSISISRVRIKIEEDRMFKDLFDKFNERYDKLNDFLNNLPNGTCVLNNYEKNKIYDYLNMCSEQYLWHKKGRIPNDVWQAWKAGIAHFIQSKESVRSIFCEEKKDQATSYYGFIKEMEEYFIETKSKLTCPDNEKI